MRLRSTRLAASATALALLCLPLSACDVGEAFSGSPDGQEDEAEATPAPVVTVNVGKAATGVPVNRPIKIQTDSGQLVKVNVSSDEGPLAGALSKDGTTWTSTDGLEPGAQYAISAFARSGEEQARLKRGFTTEELSLDQQTYASVAPLPGETVGVGMPVIVNFDVPVTDKKSIERRMQVTSKPSQPGTWHWLSDYEAHWRPKQYWKAGTEVSVDLDINGVPAGAGIYGQEDRKVDFSIGDANIYKVDANSFEMKVFSNGKLLRTLPITVGKPGFTTRSGVKVIMEKYDSKRMNSETVGIPNDSAEGYDLDNVQYAMRVTSSGEFIHAAPWSVGAQGSYAASHGCTGMSTDNAYWLYQMTKRGDVVEYTGTDRAMEYGNGYADWNMSFAEYKQGSALS